jgi:hypothetical protein
VSDIDYLKEWSRDLPSHEEHIGCGGTVVLDHEVWRCRKCRRAPLSIFETETACRVDTDGQSKEQP